MTPSPDFERDMYTFMGEVRQYIKAQDSRCANHSARIDLLAARGKLIEQAIAFKDDDEENTIDARAGRLERFADRVFFTFKAVAWISSLAGVAYAGFAFLVKSVLPHADKVTK